MKKVLLFIGICFAFNGHVSGKTENVNRYEITIGSSLRELYVEANLERVGSYLTMDWEAAEFLPDGWSTYVENLQANTPEGERINLKYEPPGRWFMENADTNRIQLKYKIRINHDDIEWEEGGHDESAYVIDDLLFFIGRAVFITAGQRPEVPDANTYRIGFQNLPDNYGLTSIWTAEMPDSEDVSRVWTAYGTHELIGSVVLIGDQITKTIQGSGVEVILSSSADYAAGLAAFGSVFEPLLSNAIKVFGSLPDSKFVLVANIAPVTKTQEPYFSGGVLHRSMSIISPFVPDENVLPMIQYVLFHEYLHLYGLAMNLDPTEMYHNYWFLEGVHDYMSTRLLHGGGLMTDDELMTAANNGLSTNFNKYLAVAGKTNIRLAGEHKFDNYDLIYSGGYIIGVAMDIAFLEASDGQYDLLKYLKDVLELGLAKKEGNYVTFKELYSLAVEKGGDAQKQLFEKYILGNEVVPLADYLKKVGLKSSLDGEGNKIIEMDNNVDFKTASRRDIFFHRRVFQTSR